MLKTDEPKYPNINIDLVGEDGNAYSIIGRCTLALRRNGLSDQVAAFRSEVTSGDYNNVLMTVMSWFSVDTDDEDDSEGDCSMCEESLEYCECED
jgi:hypothetical protein